MIELPQSYIDEVNILLFIVMKHRSGSENRDHYADPAIFESRLGVRHSQAKMYSHTRLVFESCSRLHIRAAATSRFEQT
jgi:hypothetical protein